MDEARSERVAAEAIARFLEARERDPSTPPEPFCPEELAAAALFHEARLGLDALLPGAESRAREGSDAVEEEPLPLPRIAGYEVLRELGRGGMGVVFEAEQLSPRRAVAIKVLRDPASASRVHLRLFQREVRLLAELQHPNIAAIHGAGRTEDGTPYFVMERVTGRPLDSRLWDEPPPPELPLGLFLQLASAVSHAHRRAIVHRDLKPSNVLVDAEGRVKVLDFGLARPIRDDEQEGPSLSATGPRLAGTLSYMSPERAFGHEVTADTRGDVYSMGVILYELLTGALPYDLRGRPPAEMVRILLQQDPRPPRELRPDLPRDLDAIVRKAIERQPEERYQSVDALEEDVRRFMAGAPVLAREATALDRAWRLLRRRRKSFALAGAALLALLAFVAALARTNQQLDAAREEERLAREKAEGEARRSAAVSGFLHRLLLGADPRFHPDEPTVRELLDVASAELEASPPEDREVEAELRRVLGVTYSTLNHLDAAAPHLTRGWELLESLGRTREPADMEVLYSLASVKLMLGDTEEALALLDRWLEWAEAEPPGQVAVEEMLHKAAIVLVNAGRYERAAPIVDRVLAFGERTFPPGDVLRDNLLLLRIRLDVELGRVERAQADAEEILGRFRAAAATEAFSEDAREMTGWGPQLANVLSSLGRLAEAEEVALVALPIIAGRMGEESELVANLLHLLALVRMMQGRHEEAEQDARRAIAIRTALAGEGALIVTWSTELLARILEAQGRGEEAAQLRASTPGHAAVRPPQRGS